MKPTVKLAAATPPDGGQMVLYQHDRDFTIKVNGEDLMLSHHHESELELARLGCANLVGRRSPAILIGGLGMGYTLRQTLDMLGPEARIVVGELMEDIIDWNKKFLGELNGHPLADKRVEIRAGDVVELIKGSKDRFDAILLDIDNGPKAMTDVGNSRLYGYDGIVACQRALRKHGCLAVWSAAPSEEFDELLMSCGFEVRGFRVPAYKGSKSQFRFVWVASEDPGALPSGGSKPQLPGRNRKQAGHRR